MSIASNPCARASALIESPQRADPGIKHQVARILKVFKGKFAKEESKKEVFFKEGNFHGWSARCCGFHGVGKSVLRDAKALMKPIILKPKNPCLHYEHYYCVFLFFDIVLLKLCFGFIRFFKFLIAYFVEMFHGVWCASVFF
jgi:hypothetical protein